MRQGEHDQFRRWLAATIALGAIFIGGQAWEYYGLLSNSITIGWAVNEPRPARCWVGTNKEAVCVYFAGESGVDTLQDPGRRHARFLTVR